MPNSAGAPCTRPIHHLGSFFEKLLYHTRVYRFPNSMPDINSIMRSIQSDWAVTKKRKSSPSALQHPSTKLDGR